MNFNDYLLKPLRILLFPFSLLYALIIIIRNLFYDKRWFAGTSFNFPIICIGNLSVGGTGKSPMVIYLASVLEEKYKVAVLSRGYKRKTVGYVLANEKTSALDIGDEPMLFKNKFPGMAVAVGEERVEAIPLLLHDRPETRVILLDDAFQHRKIIAGMNILLTEYSNLFTRDWYLPTGDLRDSRQQYKRADIIVVTKCPDDISESKMNEITKEIRPFPHQQVFFSGIAYGELYHIITGEKINFDSEMEALLITGIANPAPLKKYLAEKVSSYEEIAFSDHHIFSVDDLKTIKQKYSQLPASDKIIVTTEKDAVRLFKFGKELEDLPLYILPIEMKFLSNNEMDFINKTESFINSFKLNNNNNG